MSDNHVVCEVTRRAFAEMRSSAGDLVWEGREGDALAIPSADGGEIVLEVGSSPKHVAETETQTEHELETDGAFLKHTYRLGETLPGLALRYGVTVAEIQRANGFSGSFAGSSLDPGAAARPQHLRCRSWRARGFRRCLRARAEPASSPVLSDMQSSSDVHASSETIARARGGKRCAVATGPMVVR